MIYASHDALTVVAVIVAIVSIGSVVVYLLMLQRSRLGNHYVQMEILKVMNDTAMLGEIDRVQPAVGKAYGMRRKRRISLPNRPLVSKN